MTEKEYNEGRLFIQKNSGTKEEEVRRLNDWHKEAWPLVLLHKLGITGQRAGERVRM